MKRADPTRHQHPAAPGDSGAPADGVSPGEIAALRARLAEVQRERDHLIAVVEILQEISGSSHFVDVLQTIAKKLGEAFRLDRCAIFLTDNGASGEVRLVASYEDPSIRNLVIDVNRYPELKRAFETRQTVFIADAQTDPVLRAVRSQLEQRNVGSIVVTPLESEGNLIGAIFVRTDRRADAFTDADVRFVQIVATLTARALRNAHRLEAAIRQQTSLSEARRRAEIERIALISFLRRLLDHHASRGEEHLAEALLPKASGEELERLVAVALQVFEEESKG